MHAQQTEAAHQPLCKYLSNRHLCLRLDSPQLPAEQQHILLLDTTQKLSKTARLLSRWIPCTTRLFFEEGASGRRSELVSEYVDSLGLESLGRHSESLVDVKALLKRAQ
eukprot:763664-Hanusia_phi.AAC.8